LVYTELNILEGMADVALSLGKLRERRNDPDAIIMFRNSLGIFEKLGDKRGMADVYENLSRFYTDQGESDKASAMMEKSKELLR